MKHNMTRSEHVHSEDIELSAEDHKLTRPSADNHSRAFKRCLAILLPYWEIQLTLESYRHVEKYFFQQQTKISTVQQCINEVAYGRAFVGSRHYRVIFQDEDRIIWKI